MIELPMSETCVIYRYACPALGCPSIFHTVKFLCDHISLYHDSKNGPPLICGINSCMFQSISAAGYHKHIKRSHPDDWNNQRYRRNEDSHAIMVPSATDTDTVQLVISSACNEAMQIDQLSTETEICFLNQLQKKLAQVVLKHRELSLVPNSTMASLVKDIQNVIQLSQLAIGQSISRAVTANAMQSSSLENIVSNLLEQHEIIIDDVFQTVASAKKLKAYCRNHLNLVMPRQECLDSVFRNGKWYKQSYQYVSILDTLKHFLAHEDVASSVVADSHNDTMNENILRSYKDGLAYKSSNLFSKHSMVLRLHFYVDDFEVCNPIGSRRSIHKLTAVYF